MGEGKKDILEFPLENVEIPQAITLMMQAAYHTGYEGEKGQTHDERLVELCEKLEARVEEALESAQAVREEPTVEDEPYRVAEDGDVTLIYQDDMVHQVVHQGVVFQKACNMRVYDGPRGETHCIKQWNHANPIHEDEFGNEGR